MRLHKIDGRLTCGPKGEFGFLERKSKKATSRNLNLHVSLSVGLWLPSSACYPIDHKLVQREWSWTILIGFNNLVTRLTVSPVCLLPKKIHIIMKINGAWIDLLNCALLEINFLICRQPFLSKYDFRESGLVRFKKSGFDIDDLRHQKMKTFWLNSKKNGLKISFVLRKHLIGLNQP